MGRSIPLARGLVLLCAALVTAEARGQQIELRVADAPYYTSVPIDIEVHSEGFERSPEPVCGAPDIKGGELRFRGIAPNVESSISIINGRMTRSERVRFTCRFQFVARQAGAFEVGPFHVRQQGTERTTPPLRLQVTDVPLDGRLRLRVRVPEGPVYLGQHVPVDVEWWIDETLSNRIHGFIIRSPLFEREQDFRFVDDPVAARGDQSLHLATPQGQLDLTAEATRRNDGGRSWVVLSTQRTLIPMRAGEFALEPAQVEVEEVTRWRRDFFGGRTPSQTQRRLTRDVARTLRVREPPARERPESYAGAVGKGFSLDVSADRSVVQRGDPIVLTVTVQGDGNLRAIGMPKLGGERGLVPGRFRLPQEEIAGRMTEDGKTFAVTVRVLDENVREVPAIEYAWFDPELGEYQTTYSRPIALSVNPARIVSADDVVSATPEPTTNPEDGPKDGGTAGGELGAPAFTTSGADLAVERDVGVLTARPALSPVFHWAAHTGALVFVGAAFVLRRRREVPQSVRDLRELHTRTRERLRAASGRPAREAAGEVAATLRGLRAGDPAAGSDAIDALLQECDELLYAPDASAPDDLGGELARRALALVDDDAETRA